MHHLTVFGPGAGPEAEEGMARIDGTISLGFVGHTKFQVVGQDPREKLEHQRDHLHAARAGLAAGPARCSRGIACSHEEP